MSRAFVGRLDLLTLQLFVIAVEERSIARAAERGGIAASAVSKRISELERAVGAHLLYRNRRGVEPTDAGLVVLEHARTVLHDLEQFEADISEYSRGVRGQIRLFATETATVSLLPEQIAGFLHAHPFVRIELREELSAAIVRAVSENIADIGIVAGEVVADGLQLLPYREDNLVAVVPKGHPLALRKRVGLAELLEFELIGQTHQSSVETLLLMEANRLGMPIKIRLWLDDYGAICRVIEAGHGVSIVPREMATLYAQSTDVLAVPIEEPWATRVHRLCVRDIGELTPPARRLVEHLIGHRTLPACELDPPVLAEPPGVARHGRVGRGATVAQG